jgi:hypothetical protein
MASYLLFFLLGFSLLGLVGIYLLVKAFANIRPSEQRLRQDLEKMRAEVNKLNIDLAPITKEELDLFRA